MSPRAVSLVREASHAFRTNRQVDGMTAVRTLVDELEVSTDPHDGDLMDILKGLLSKR